MKLKTNCFALLLANQLLCSLVLFSHVVFVGHEKPGPGRQIGFRHTSDTKTTDLWYIEYTTQYWHTLKQYLEELSSREISFNTIYTELFYLSCLREITIQTVLIQCDNWYTVCIVYIQLYFNYEYITIIQNKHVYNIVIQSNIHIHNSCIYM